MILALSILTGGVIAVLLFRLFFETVGEFFECVRYWLTPDIISLFRGEWGEDGWASLKLFFYFVLSIGCGALTYFSLHKLFG